MTKHKQAYNIKDICYSVIIELSEYFNRCSDSENISNRNKRNCIINSWIVQYYSCIFNSSLKDHPLK